MNKAPVHRRLDGLDALRGLAALSVVVYHYAHRGPELYPELGSRVKVTDWGQYGVHLFFVISGFVIFMTLRRSTPRKFVVTRFIRLYPVYWLAVLITFVVVALAGLPGREVTLGEAVLNLTMLQAFLGVPHVDGAYWTLAAELMFYVQVGVLYFFGLLSGRWLLGTLYIWVSAVATLAVGASIIGGSFRVLLLVPGVRWLPLFIAGMAVFLIASGDRRLATMVLPGVCAAAMLPEGLETACVASLLIATVLAVATMVRSVPRFWRWTVVLGGMSYPLYLVHQNIGFVLLRQFDVWGLSQGAGMGLSFAVILVLAAAVTYGFDIPVRERLRHRLVGAGTAA